MTISEMLAMDAISNFPTTALARLCVWLLLWAPFASAQDVVTMLARRADSLVQEQMKKQNIAGLALTIVVDRKIVISRAYGLADLENQVPVSTATLFRTGSIAKPMTSTAAMALYQAGKLDLDAPVQKYCPAFPKKAMDYYDSRVAGPPVWHSSLQTRHL
jgi:serine beta-lactamase-like protein LACTB, mitochondrial